MANLRDRRIQVAQNLLQKPTEIHFCLCWIFAIRRTPNESLRLQRRRLATEQSSVLRKSQQHFSWNYVFRFLLSCIRVMLS